MDGGGAECQWQKISVGRWVHQVETKLPAGESGHLRRVACFDGPVCLHYTFYEFLGSGFSTGFWVWFSLFRGGPV